MYSLHETCKREGNREVDSKIKEKDMPYKC